MVLLDYALLCVKKVVLKTSCLCSWPMQQRCGLVFFSCQTACMLEQCNAACFAGLATMLLISATDTDASVVMTDDVISKRKKGTIMSRGQFLVN